MNLDKEQKLPTVFFDGGCPLCRREIAHYQRIDSAQRLRWIDITQEPQALADAGLSRADAMARLHVRDRHGIWQTGAWGFVAMWRELPGYRWLAKCIRVSRTEALLDWPYRWFARRRLRSRCEHGCSLPPEGKP